MIGPEHYTESERLLNDAANAAPDGDPADVALLLQFAQVHATLALAAATALNDAEDGLSMVDFRAWDDAAGVNAHA
jgi:hypothetical protein